MPMSQDLEQSLLFFDRKLQVGGDGVGELGGIFMVHGCDYGSIVQRLAQLYISPRNTPGDALHPGPTRWHSVLRGR